MYYKAKGMFIIYVCGIGFLVSPFLSGGLFSVLARITVSNKVKIFFVSYIRVVLLVAIIALCLAHFYKDIVTSSLALLMGALFSSFINGDKYFVSCTLSQQEVTIQCITSRFTKKTFVLPVEQITNAKLSAGKRWYNFPQVYTITVNDEEGKFYLLNPITSSDYFYLINNDDTAALKPAGE